MKLVFVHGAGGSSLSFYYQMRHFRNSKGIDLPGHPVGTPCTSIEGYMEWVRGFIAARRYKDVVLCGHSMGGAITQLYALTYPEELKGIILIGTGSRLKVHPKYLQEALDAQGDSSRWLENRKEKLAKVGPDVQQMLMRKAVDVGPGVEHNDLLCCDKFDVMDRVQQIGLPTQVVCGSEDVMTPCKYSDYLASNINGARRTVLEGATHYVQMERHQEVNGAIDGFLAALR